MISSSLVFLYFGSKIVFIEDITKLLPQEGPASKSSLVFDELKVKDMVMLQVTADGKDVSELAEISDSFVEQLMNTDSTTKYIANILSGINPQNIIENNFDKIQDGL